MILDLTPTKSGFLLHPCRGDDQSFFCCVLIAANEAPLYFYRFLRLYSPIISRNFLDRQILLIVFGAMLARFRLSGIKTSDKI